MAKENKVEVEAGIPGFGKAKYTQTTSPTETEYSYSCVVNFNSFEDAKEFRETVEKAVAEIKGKIYQSRLDTVEKTEQ